MGSSQTCFLGLTQNRERKSKLCPLYFLFRLFLGGGWGGGQLWLSPRAGELPWRAAPAVSPLPSWGQSSGVGEAQELASLFPRTQSQGDL